MSFSFRLISHPADEGKSNPRLLKDHLSEVGNISKKVAEKLSFIDFPIKSEQISKVAYLIGICHDFGKATSFFQEYIKHPDNPNKTEKRFHSQISSLFGYYVVAKETGDKDLAYIAYYVIYYHHSDLDEFLTNITSIKRRVNLVTEQATDIGKGSATELQAIYDILIGRGNVDILDFLSPTTLSRLYSEICSNNNFESVNPKSLNNYFMFLLFYSILLYSDKLSASGIGYDGIDHERKVWSSIPPSLIDSYVSKLSSEVALDNNRLSEINALRNKAYQDVTRSIQSLDIKRNRLLLVELPTGLGKTMISVAAAIRLREKVEKEFGFRPRIVYSLPFLSIIDDNFSRISEAFLPLANGKQVPTSLLLKHHHLADIYFSFSNTESYGSEDNTRRILLMEGWNSEFIVTSFVQLFHSLITNRNSTAMKFPNIINSIIILDEVQALRLEYLPLVKEVLKFLTEKMNSWIIFMTATMPAFIDPGEATSLVSDSENYFRQMDRIEYVRIKDPLTLDNLVSDIMKIEKKSIMVVVNTIESSRQIYIRLKSALMKTKNSPDTSKGYADFGDLSLVYLSSGVTPHQRTERIRFIKESSKRCIAVTTQLVEAGVDIDFDIVIRDLAPLDSIVQAGGRANRNNQRARGEVRLIKLVDNKGEEYAKKIYDPVLLDITEGLLDGMFKDKDKISETEMHHYVKDYYEEIRKTKNDKEYKKYLGYLETLMFNEIHKFSLIENTYEKADVFVPIDDRAKEVWKRYMAIRGIPDPLKRYNELLGIRNSFYDYVVSVNKELVGNVDEPVVNANEYSIKWDNETGVSDHDPFW